MGNINDSLHVRDTLTAGTWSPGDRAIAANKVIHQYSVNYAQSTAADVAAITIPVHTFYKDGTIVAFEVTPRAKPTGGDKAYTVDLKRGNAGGAAASVLSAVVTVNSGSADRTPQAGTISSAACSDGDTLEIVIATSGSTGSQGIGVTVTITITENPNS